MKEKRTLQELDAELKATQLRLEEAEETLRAIRNNEIDALIVDGPQGQQVFTLQGADLPYRTLMETMSEGALTTTADGTILYCNSHFSELIGMPLNKIIGGSIHNFVISRNRQSLVAMLQIGGREDHRGEFSLKSSRGDKIPVSVSVSSLTFSGVEGFCAVITDLTEQKRIQNELEKAQSFLEEKIVERTSELSKANALLHGEIEERKQLETALKESEATFRVIAEMNPFGAWETDPDGRVTYLSQSWLDMVGMTMDHCKEFGWMERYAPGKGDKMLEAWQRCRETGLRWEYEHHILDKNDKYRWVLSRGVPLRDQSGRILKWVGMNIDITDRKRAEEALRKAHEELELQVQRRTAQLRESEKIALDQMSEIETYYNTTPIGLCVLDSDFRFLRINELLARWNGIPASKHVGKTLREILPQVAGELEQVARQVIETGNPVTNMEITGETPDQPGLKRIWLTGWHPMKDSTGTVVNLSVVVEEVTQHRQLEDQLHQSQKMEAIGTLAGGIAHDFNNMLAAILGFTEMALEDLPDRPDVERNLQHVSRAAMRARDLVKQILAFSRKTGHERNPLSLLPLVRETVQLLRASIPATIKITFVVTATSDIVLAAPIEIQQILMNLATNASLAMQQKGGTMEISLTDIDFDPDLPVFGAGISPGEYVQLVVKDTGTGMTPDVMKRVFEPFFTTRDVDKGTGMGLAVVYGIVKDLQGSITVESELGVGSTFRVLLPKVRTDAHVEVVQPDEIPGGNERILFVDDEEMLVEWGRFVLERLGYKVTAIKDSQEALKTFSTDPSLFDLVITDHAMPQIAGAELAKELLNIRSDLPIILCTGHSDSISPESSREIGIKEFLTKPLSKKELAEAVRRVLDGKDWRAR